MCQTHDDSSKGGDGKLPLAEVDAEQSKRMRGWGLTLSANGLVGGLPAGTEAIVRLVARIRGLPSRRTTKKDDKMLGQRSGPACLRPVLVGMAEA